MPTITPETKEPQVRAIPTRRRRRYFRKIYERYDVLDTAKIVKPDGMVRIYDAMQLLAQRHGGEGWSKNPFAKYWHFRLERILLNGEKRYQVRQKFIVNEPDCFDYEDEWKLRCQPDGSPRTVAMKEAAAVFKKARLELIAALKDGSLRLFGKAQYKEYSVEDFASGVVTEQWFKIIETGTLPSEALKDRDNHDSDAEGDLIYLYVTEASLNAFLNGSAVGPQEIPPANNPSSAVVPEVEAATPQMNSAVEQSSSSTQMEAVEEFDAAPSFPPYRPRKQEAVKLAIEACYPGGVPYKKRGDLLFKINEWLVANGHDPVSGDTFDRARGVRPQAK